LYINIIYIVPLLVPTGNGYLQSIYLYIYTRIIIVACLYLTLCTGVIQFGFDTPAVLSHYCVCMLIYTCIAYMGKYVSGGVGTRTHTYYVDIYIYTIVKLVLSDVFIGPWKIQSSKPMYIYTRVVHRDGLYAEGGCATHRTLLRGCLYIMYTYIHTLHIHSYVYIFQYPIFI